MSVDRRDLFRLIAAAGVGTAPFHRALAAEVSLVDEKKPEPPKVITAEMVERAEWVAGITLTDAERKQVAASLTRSLPGLIAARKDPLPNSVPPAFQFNPAPDLAPSSVGRGTVTPPKVEVKKPAADDDLAFLSVVELAELVRTKQVSSVELTKLALARLKKYDPALLCVVTLTEELAIQQAEAADKEIAAGKYRGPLHGLPWGAKDLIAVPGYPTTWGAARYKTQKFDETAAVAKRLADAGAVLVAKLTLGALALGDQWFGGMTRNPWNVKTGSSGSSAGSCSAVAAGLVPFAIGSETLGSIVSPSRTCGVTGLRPTFGRVSRAGCMTLSWTMDKLGPITRSVDDAALVFGAIHGRDPADPTSLDRPFDWPGKIDLKGVTVGFVEGRQNADARAELKVLQDLGMKLVPVELPNKLPLDAMKVVLDVECAAAFDELPRNAISEGYGRFWGSTFRAGQFVTAVEYIRAMRYRTLLIQQMAEMMKKVDVYVGPAGFDLLHTNLSGHPSVCLPNGLRGDLPTALTFTGRLFEETTLLAVAKAYQEATGHHRKRPPMDKVTKENATG
ncbi:MAG: amidase [Fimbriiglobus sp.]|jgi:Asp-tRNA(Asn)/Glu-tRNA(Gln) amidotransferase A subunit family amidase|nr:amidase [Fimbriiglobus sp.]